MTSEKNTNFFMVPHLFEEKYGDQLTFAEKYFFIILLKLENRFADNKGWFWHKDSIFTTNNGKIIRGFEIYGFSASSCKRVRKKLISIGLIKTKYGWHKSGNRSGTYYRINHKPLNDKVQNEPPIA